MKEEIEKILAGGGNYIGSYHNYEIKIDSINAENFYLTGLTESLEKDENTNDSSNESTSPKFISEDIIPPELQKIYCKLSQKKKLMCLAIVYLQEIEERGAKLFHLDNDWWGVYSPLVYDEALNLPRDPEVFYDLMLEIGMGFFRQNCTRDYMMQIGGIFLKDYHSWSLEEYLDGYGTRTWVYNQKKRIADTLGEILDQLHKQMKI